MPEQRGRPPALQTMRQNTRSFCTSGTLPRFHGHGSSGLRLASLGFALG
jgi:hypothetical protein